MGTRSHWISLLAIATLGTGTAISPASAQKLVFDFDTDGDPSTIQNEIAAEVGDFVKAYLVVQDFPHPYSHLGGLQFGLDYGAGQGLVLEGMLGEGDRAGFMHDGPEGIAIALQHDIQRDELPMFFASFVFRVTSADAQTVKVSPSEGWGRVYQGILFAVGNGTGPAGTLIEDENELTAQLPAFVNRGPALPVHEITWGAVKKLFSDDAL